MPCVRGGGLRRTWDGIVLVLQRVTPAGGDSARNDSEYTESMAVVDAERHHQDLVDELIAAVEAYNPGVDKELLARAFRFAATAHEGQARRSGEPFIHHPWAVAKICAELHLDEQSLAAALLHDVVEDTERRARRRARRVRRRDRAARRGRHQADADELPDAASSRRPRTTAR